MYDKDDGGDATDSLVVAQRNLVATQRILLARNKKTMRSVTQSGEFYAHLVPK